MVPGYSWIPRTELCTRMWIPKWSQDLLLDTPTSQFLITLGEPASCYGNNSKLEFNIFAVALSDDRDTAGGEGSCWWNGRRVRRRLDESLPTHATGATHTLPTEPPTLHSTDPRMKAWPHIRGMLKRNATIFTPAARTVVFFTVSLALIWRSLVFGFGGRNFGNQFGVRRWPYFVAHHALAFRESYDGASDHEIITPEIARSARAP